MRKEPLYFGVARKIAVGDKNHPVSLRLPPLHEWSGIIITPYKRSAVRGKGNMRPLCNPVGVEHQFQKKLYIWSMSDPKTAEREIRPLKSLDDNYPKYIISTDIITAEIEGIEHINIVDWLLTKE